MRLPESHWIRATCALAVLLAALDGCSKDPPPPPGPALAASVAAAQALISAVLPVAPAPAAPAVSAPEAVGSVPAAAVLVPTEAPGATPPPSPHEVAAPKTFACGAKGQPACPTQAWMKANMAPAAASGDAGDLEKALNYVAAHAPAGMGNWASIARSGAAKAKAGDIDGAKSACKSCHDQYKAKYKAEVRDRPF